MSSTGFIPYGRQTIDDADIAAVVEVLRSDWLTTGPAVERFEEAVCAFSGAAHGVAVCNGTAALHTAMHALGIGPGDEVIVPPMTFAATANAVLYAEGIPVFADVDPGTLCLDPAEAERHVTPRTKAIVGVDYAGHPCDWDALRDIARRKGLALVADSCHALGAEYHGRKVGTLADLTVFSFHPVKHVTTGEGGMIVTDAPDLAARMRRFRNHGISTDHRQREKQGAWFYEMVELGYNYRITDIQCALGVSQLSHQPEWLARREAIAAQYRSAFAGNDAVHPLALRDAVRNAWHLFVVRVAHGVRDKVFAQLRRKGIGVNVHYVPVHLHPYYRERFGFAPGLCPVAEAAYGEVLSIPMFPALADDDVRRVVETLSAAVSGEEA
jgi:perosamine synthetase